MRSNGVESMNIDMMAFLAHFKFFQVGTNKAVFDDFFNYKAFLLAFVRPSHPLVKRSRYEFIIERWNSTKDNRLQLQYHLRHLTPITSGHSVNDLEGLPLRRQMMKINHVPHGSIRHDVQNQTERDLDLEERALSVSLIKFFDQDGTFRLLVLGDVGVSVTAPYPDGYISDKQHSEVTWERTGIDPWTSGGDSGPAHFLVALFVLLETWHNSWNTTLDTIDKFISFEVGLHM